MNKNELSKEELEVIEKMRTQKAEEESALKEEQESLDKLRGVAEKFDQAVSEAHAQIKSRIESARKELKQAEKLSEIYGVPFSSDVVEMELNRKYVPSSLRKKWPELANCEELEEVLSSNSLDKLEDIIYHFDEIGWEEWSTSSLTC